MPTLRICGDIYLQFYFTFCLGYAVSFILFVFHPPILRSSLVSYFFPTARLTISLFFLSIFSWEILQQLHQQEYTAPNGTLIGESRTGTNLVLMAVLSRNLSGRVTKNHEKPVRTPKSVPRFEPPTSWIQVYTVNAKPARSLIRFWRRVVWHTHMCRCFGDVLPTCSGEKNERLEPVYHSTRCHIAGDRNIQTDGLLQFKRTVTNCYEMHSF
jgi:hypothetical protein